MDTFFIYLLPCCSFVSEAGMVSAGTGTLVASRDCELCPLSQHGIAIEAISITAPKVTRVAVHLLVSGFDTVGSRPFLRLPGQLHMATAVLGGSNTHCRCQGNKINGGEKVNKANKNKIKNNNNKNDN